MPATYADRSLARLEAAGIEATVVVRFGMDAVVIQLETPEGEPRHIATAAADILGDIPVVFTFSAPTMEL